MAAFMAPLSRNHNPAPCHIMNTENTDQNYSPQAPMMIAVGGIILVMLAFSFIMVATTALMHRQTANAAQKHMSDCQDLAVGTYEYRDVYPADDNSTFDGQLMTIVKQVDIFGKDPAHRTLSADEIGTNWIPILLPKDTKIRGALNRPGADQFTGLLEVSVTKEGLKQIATYYPFTGGPTN